MSDANRIALVTGGNRGLGFEICRQLARAGVRALLTSRSRVRGQEATTRLRELGLDVLFHELDVTSPESVAGVKSFVEREVGRVDILVNNAGMHVGHAHSPGASVFDAGADALAQSMAVNVAGPLLLAQAFVPMMKARGYGRVVNVSSGLGQLSGMGGGWAAYRISKAALNALTRVLAEEVRGTNVLVNAVCPGWVRTDMGGAGAPRSVEEGAAGIVWAALLPDGGPTGGFFRDGEPLAW